MIIVNERQPKTGCLFYYKKMVMLKPKGKRKENKS